MFREDQDKFAAESQRRAAVAQAEGRFTAETIPIRAPNAEGDSGATFPPSCVLLLLHTAMHPLYILWAEVLFVASPIGWLLPYILCAAELVTADDGVRASTTAAKLAALRPSFAADGCTTAGNSSQVSDGAACVIVARRSTAETSGWSVLGRLVSYAVTGVPPALMGIGPAAAIPMVRATKYRSLYIHRSH